MPYEEKFLGGVTLNLPEIAETKHPSLATLIHNPSANRIDFDHHSVVVNKDRRLAVFSACNINGALIPDEDVARGGSFKESKEILSDEQLGTPFYELCGHRIDKGHLTKYEDVIWGDGLDAKQLEELGRSTNFYPNAVPQHRRLNRGLWKSLELYILDSETDENELKISMFTGPVLNDNDPVFVEKVGGRLIQIPLHFWKIVVYKKKGQLYALGFMMSHKTLLEEDNLVRDIGVRSRLAPDEEEIYFNDYKHSQPYQVRVEQIETLAGITLSADLAIVKPYKDERPLELIFKEIDVRAFGGRRLLSEYVFPKIVTE